MLGIRRYALKGDTMRTLTLLKSYFERKAQKEKNKTSLVCIPEVSLAWPIF
jgi:hypothetical protein